MIMTMSAGLICVTGFVVSILAALLTGEWRYLLAAALFYFAMAKT